MAAWKNTPSDWCIQMKLTFQIWIAAAENASPAACLAWEINQPFYPQTTQLPKRFYLSSYHKCNLAFPGIYFVVEALENMSTNEGATCRIEWRHSVIQVRRLRRLRQMRTASSFRLRRLRRLRQLRQLRQFFRAVSADRGAFPGEHENQAF